jgi:hypothetical protein
MYVHSDRENKIVLVSLSEGATGGGRDKESVKEWDKKRKILKQPSYMWI